MVVVRCRPPRLPCHTSKGDEKGRTTHSGDIHSGRIRSSPRWLGGELREDLKEEMNTMGALGSGARELAEEGLEGELLAVAPVGADGRGRPGAAPRRPRGAPREELEEAARAHRGHRGVL